MIHEYSKSYIPFWDKNAITKWISFWKPIHCLLTMHEFDSLLNSHTSSSYSSQSEVCSILPLTPPVHAQLANTQRLSQKWFQKKKNARPALLESLHHSLHSRRIDVEISGYFAIGKFKCMHSADKPCAIADPHRTLASCPFGKPLCCL